MDNFNLKIGLGKSIHHPLFTNLHDNKENVNNKSSPEDVDFFSFPKVYKQEEI